MKLFGFDVYIAGKDIVKDDVLDKVCLVIFLVVKRFRLESATAMSETTDFATGSVPSTKTMFSAWV